jgi:hypothetical protein
LTNKKKKKEGEWSRRKNNGRAEPIGDIICAYMEISCISNIY